MNINDRIEHCVSVRIERHAAQSIERHAAQSIYLKRKLGLLLVLRDLIRVLTGRTEEELLQADHDRIQEQLLQGDKE